MSAWCQTRQSIGVQTAKLCITHLIEKFPTAIEDCCRMSLSLDPSLILIITSSTIKWSTVQMLIHRFEIDRGCNIYFDVSTTPEQENRLPPPWYRMKNGPSR
mmetsp:Transcript_3592/g.6938  ORF Transcript_3592/g.6938 Transcript_3592/m.6938 type:complete len:102 (-) Transcript_3592:37-342(-)